jgi:proteasome lid subunit RPN8/RPN11
MDEAIEAVLPANLAGALSDACYSRLPQETCGVLFGSAKAGIVMVDGHAVIRNSSPNPEETFRFSPHDWVPAYYEAQKNQRNIVGFFHSHPDGSMQLSAADTEGSLPWRTYWIIGLTPAGSQIVVYRRDDAERWQSVPLRIVTDDTVVSDGLNTRINHPM